MIRKAKIKDIRKIQEIINVHAKNDSMLPRSLNELYDNIRDFWIYEDKGKVVGCCALHIAWETLAEIKSLAVVKSRQGTGIGIKLVSTCLYEARDLGARQVFVLTYIPKFFLRFGFKRVRHEDLPHKVWAECINCPKFPNCQEIALLKSI